MTRPKNFKPINRPIDHGQIRRDRKWTGLSIWVGLVICASGCSTYDTKRSTKFLNLVLDPTVLIQQDISVPSSLIGQIAGISTDSRGNVFVADGLAFSVKKYSPEGVYLSRIGSRGRGPGEIQSMTGFLINSGDQIVLSDWRNGRITTYQPNGDLFSSVEFTALQYVREFYEIGSNYLIPSMPLSSNSRAASLFHVFDRDSLLHQVSFGERKLFDELERDEVFRIGGADLGSILISSPTEVLFAPQFYTGVIHRMNKVGTRWINGSEIKGHTFQKTAIELVREPPFEKGYVSASAGRKIGYIFRNESMGLWKIADGRLVHFSLQQSGNQRLLGVEYFSGEGSFIGYGELERYETQGPNKVGYGLKVPLAKSSEDIFYFANYQETGEAEIVGYRLLEISP